MVGAGIYMLERAANYMVLVNILVAVVEDDEGTIKIVLRGNHT